MDHTEFGWLFLYICIFGLSDYIVNKWIKTDVAYILYYFTAGVIGFGLLYYNRTKYNKDKID
jgi:hypothetical protein